MMQRFKIHLINRPLILLTVILLNGCALIVPIVDFKFAKPDYCDPKLTACKLEQPKIVVTKLKSGEARDIEVCACNPWNNSGITVTEGNKYIFEVVEISECWQDASKKSDPRIGWTEPGLLSWSQNFLFHGYLQTDKASLYALVGIVGKRHESTFAVLDNNPDPKINLHKCDNETGKPEPYSYKNSYPITIMQSGELYFYANDRKGYYYNNKGKLKVRVINVTKEPNN